MTPHPCRGLKQNACLDQGCPQQHAGFCECVVGRINQEWPKQLKIIRVLEAPLEFKLFWPLLLHAIVRAFLDTHTGGGWTTVKYA